MLTIKVSGERLGSFVLTPSIVIDREKSGALTIGFGWLKWLGSIEFQVIKNDHIKATKA